MPRDQIESRIGELNAELMRIVSDPGRGAIAWRVHQIEGEVAGLQWVLEMEVSHAA